MINARAARRFRLAGKTYAKGDPVSLSEGQFADLEAVGLVARSRAPSRETVAKVTAAAAPKPNPTHRRRLVAKKTR